MAASPPRITPEHIRAPLKGSRLTQYAGAVYAMPTGGDSGLAQSKDTLIYHRRDTAASPFTVARGYFDSFSIRFDLLRRGQIDFHADGPIAFEMGYL